MSGATKEHFAGFGFVQFFAALHVFSHHMFMDMRPWSRSYYRWGASWPTFFFVLSGFKLTHSQLMRTNPEKVDPFLPYIWRRVVRLLPMYYLSLFLTWFCQVLLRARIPCWIALPFNLTLISTWIGTVVHKGWHGGWHGSSWYMSDLLFHQIVWRWVFFVVNRLSDRALCFTLVCCVLLTALRCTCIQLRCCEQEIVLWAPYTFHQFLSGMCLAQLHVRRSKACNGASEDTYIILIVGGRRVPISAVGAFLLILVAFQLDPAWMSVYAKNCIGTGALHPLHLLLVWCIALGDGPLDWLCQRHPFNLMSELSFGVYILHGTMLRVKSIFPAHWGHNFLFWCFLVPITVFSAFLAARYVDRPIQAWAANFLRASTQRAHEKTS